MTNKKLRVAIAEHGLKQWQVAKLLDIDESKFSRMLREELPEAETDRIIGLINRESKGDEK